MKWLNFAALNMDDISVDLQLAFGNESGGPEGNRTIAFKQLRADDQVDKTPFIFERDKKNPLGRHRPLANRYQACHLDPLAIFLVRELSGVEDSLSIELGS